MPEASPILVNVRDRVATVTLNRPERKNAITFAMWRSLRDIFDTLAADRDVAVVVLAGSGDAFCSGADVRDPAYSADPTPLAVAHRIKQMALAATALRNLAKPTIASVNGVAVGAGWSLALCCDVVLAAESARFSAKFIDLGVALDAGGTWLLPRLAGLQLAKHLAFTAEFINARRAAEHGLVLRVLPDADLAADVARYAAGLAARSAVALAQIKYGLNSVASWTFEQACEYEGQAQAACVAGRELAALATRNGDPS